MPLAVLRLLMIDFNTTIYDKNTGSWSVPHINKNTLSELVQVGELNLWPFKHLRSSGQYLKVKMDSCPLETLQEQMNAKQFGVNNIS